MFALNAIRLWLPMVLFVTLLLLVVLTPLACCCYRCCQTRQGKQAAQSTDVYISRLMSYWVIFVPKLKILISMAQVQEIFTNNITMPEMFVQWLSAINLWYVDLPLDCVVNINFHSRLIYRTLTPLGVQLALLTVATISARCGRHEHAASALDGFFLVMFLVYPGTCSIIFATFGCDKLDDGSEFLAVDYSIDCHSTYHLLMKVYALVMILIYPIGVPVIYFIVIRLHVVPIDRLAAIETSYIKASREAQLLDVESVAERGAAPNVSAADGDEVDEVDEGAGASHLGNVVEEEALGALTGIAGSHYQAAFDKFGAGNALVEGTSLVRSQAIEIWHELQTYLGIEFEDESSTTPLAIARSWPTYELIPQILRLEDHTLVERAKAEAVGDPQVAAQLSGLSQDRERAKQSDEAALQWLSTQCIDSRDGVAPEKPPVLVKVLEEERARAAYLRDNEEALEVRARRRWHVEHRKSGRHSTTAQEEPAEIDALVHVLLNKDWVRMPLEARTEPLTEAQRTNRPQIGDVLLSINDVAPTSQAHAKELLRCAGHEQDGHLVALEVLRKTAWRGIEVPYTVRVVVRKIGLVQSNIFTCSAGRKKHLQRIARNVAMARRSPTGAEQAQSRTPTPPVRVPRYLLQLLDQYEMRFRYWEVCLSSRCLLANTCAAMLVHSCSDTVANLALCVSHRSLSACASSCS